MNFVKKHPLLTAFLIPFFICIIICIGNGVYPFGDYCLLHMDLYHQYLPFFNELWEKLRNGASPLSDFKLVVRCVVDYRHCKSAESKVYRAHMVVCCLYCGSCLHIV